MQPELLLDARAELGEGPVWDVRKGCLYWVDIHAGRLHTYTPADGNDSFIELGETLGCVAPAAQGGFVLGLQSGVYLLDAQGVRTALARPEAALPSNRFNDGKCDPAGRFVAGTMDDLEKEASGSLYTFSAGGTFKVLRTGVRISNGLAWSPDRKTFYFIDTPTCVITAFDYDDVTGSIANPRTVVQVPAEMGWPDGMTIDTEGTLWVGLWGGAAVARFDPTSGQLIEKIAVPALNVTSCTFGGPDLNELYITSAHKGMTQEQLTAYPLSGGLFRIKTSVRGLPAHVFDAQS